MASKFKISTVFTGLDKISKPLRKLQGNLRKFVAKTRRQFRLLRADIEKLSGAVKGVGKNLLRAGAVGATAFGALLTKGAQFEQSITVAGTKFGEAFAKGTEGAKMLEEAALKTGATTEFTASAAALGLNNLGLAGFNAAQAMAALPKVVDLATVAQIELDEATVIATKSLGAFNLKTTDATQLAINMARVSDVLAKTQNTTNVTMGSLFETISTGAAVFQSAGVSIETFSALAGTLGDAAIDGSSAGTALQAAILGITAATPKGAKMLKQLGVVTKDARGDMLPILDVFESLEKSLDGLGTADQSKILNQIFGRRGAKAVIKILAKGTGEVRMLGKSLEDSGGSTERLAVRIRNTTQGAFKTLISTIEDVSLGIFNAGNETIGWQSVIEDFTGLVRANKPQTIKFFRDIFTWVTKNSKKIGAWATVIKNLIITIVSIKVATLVWTTTIALLNIQMRIVSISALFLGASFKVLRVVGASLVIGVRLLGATFMFLTKILRLNPIGLLLTTIIALVAFWPKILSSIDDTQAWRDLGDAIGFVVDKLESLLSFDLQKINDAFGLGGVSDFVSRNIIEPAAGVFGGDGSSQSKVVAPVTQSERISSTMQTINNNQTVGINVGVDDGAKARVVNDGGLGSNLKLTASGGF